MQPEDGNRILFFSEAFEQEPEEIGGKGYGLAQMTRLGMPVPPGFIIPVSFCRKILDKGFQRYHDELKEQTDLAIKKLEKIVKRKFGDPKKPLFVSVRSGAPISMPGMMETILNIGLSEKTVNTFARLGQKINILACPWADYDPPPIDFNRFLKEEVIPQLENRKKILVYCTGGHGRTGTFVASLISILEPEISDPILEIRKRYCKQAVETFAQAESIFALRGMELPQRYGEEFFTEREYWGLPNF